MANIKVSELPSASSFGDNDYAMIVQGGENKKITKEVFKNSLTQTYYNTAEVDNIPNNIKTNLLSIVLPAGLYVGTLSIRNHGGGDNIYKTFVYFDNNDTNEALSEFASIDWSREATPIVLYVSQESTYYARVKHSSQYAHAIDGELQLIKLK